MVRAEGGVVCSVLICLVLSAFVCSVPWCALYVVLDLTRVILVEGAGGNGVRGEADDG